MRIESPDDVRRWTAFLDLCAMLAPGAKERKPPSEIADWETIVRLASEHFVSSAVWRAISGSGEAQDEVGEYFHAVREMNAERNRMMLDGLSKVLAALEEFGVKAVLLKGAASLASGLYDDPAERILTDIDLLIAPGQIELAESALRSHGYRDAVPPPKRWLKPSAHHLPALAPAEGGFGIELHSALGEARDRMPAAAAVCERAIPLTWRGHTVFVPDPADAVIHNIVHAQVHHGLHARGAVELRQVRELALLAMRHRNSLDWAGIQRRLGDRAVLAAQAAHSRVLMGVAFPVDEGNAKETMRRLQAAVANSGIEASGQTFSHAMADLSRFYVTGFLRNPRLAINLLNPLWWPDRIRGILAAFKNTGRIIEKAH
jgi:hypothetical protein